MIAAAELKNNDRYADQQFDVDSSNYMIRDDQIQSNIPWEQFDEEVERDPVSNRCIDKNGVSKKIN